MSQKNQKQLKSTLIMSSSTKTIALLLLASFCLSSCAALQGKKKTTLLLDEIQKDQSAKGKKIDANAVWVSATIKRRWVPGKFRGSRVFVHGHYEDFVEVPGHWKAQ